MNRPYTPVTLFLLSRPLEQLEFIRLSNFIAEICFVPDTRTRTQRFMLPRKLQSRYRRHLFDLKPLFQLPLARRSLNQLSRLRIHLVQEFDIRSIQTRKNVLETNIATHASQVSGVSKQLPQNALFPRSRLRSTSSFCAVWQSVFVACVLSPFFIIEKKKRDVVLKRQPPFLTKNHPRSS